jgi:hypothetical protein
MVLVLMLALIFLASALYCFVFELGFGFIALIDNYLNSLENLSGLNLQLLLFAFVFFVIYFTALIAKHLSKISEIASLVENNKQTLNAIQDRLDNISSLSLDDVNAINTNLKAVKKGMDKLVEQADKAMKI